MKHEERRGAPREEVTGVVRISLKHARLECPLRNLSATGAQVEIAETVALPDEIDVEIHTRRRRARVVWRAAGCMGVSFLQGRDLKGSFGRRRTPPDPIGAPASGAAGWRESLARLKELLTFSGRRRAEAAAADDVAPSFPELAARIGLRQSAHADS